MGFRGALGKEMAVPDIVQQILDLIIARPLATVGCASVTVLYLQLMRGPRAR